MSDLTIREMDQGEEFADWFSDLLIQEEEGSGNGAHAEDHYLVLTNEIGDWIGGLRYTLRGGVAHLLEVGVAPDVRHQGHAHRLLLAFEERARESEAHLAEFWTEDLRAGEVLTRMGWRTVVQRDQYMGRRTWYLMEKQITA